MDASVEDDGPSAPTFDAGALVAPDAGVEPGHARIESVHATGPCRASTVLSSDGTSVALGMPGFAVASGALRINNSASCTFKFAVDVPAGQSYALGELYVDGNLSLGEGSSAIVTADYRFLGGPLQTSAKVSQHLIGPRDGAWSLPLQFAAPSYSPCTDATQLDMMVKLAVNAAFPDPIASVTLNRLSKMTFVLRPCTP